MRIVARLICLLLAAFVLGDPGLAQQSRRVLKSTVANARDEADIRDRLSAGTIGLAGGLLEGAPIHFAAEIARVVDDGGTMHVLPIVTRGPTDNVNDLLYLKGVD